jgi:FkbM family methyltransferase
MISPGGILKPQYFFRPRQILRRIFKELRPDPGRDIVTLPWGSRIEVDTRDTVGQALALQGLYDVVTSEVLWRLTAAGDVTLDVGANVGYFTSLLARCAGPKGQVLAFEPHPATFAMLQRNAEVQGPQSARIQAFQVALSNVDGDASLDLFAGQECNTSYAFLTQKPSAAGIPVRISRADRYVEQNQEVGVLKIDAQWHESSVLEGFGTHLSSGKIRDVVFEEESPYPAESHKILLDAGYRIFWFAERLRGPRMISPTAKPTRKRPYDLTPSYLATLDSVRAQKRLSALGWQCFS